MYILGTVLNPWKELSSDTLSRHFAEKLLPIGRDWYQVVFMFGVVGLTLSLLTIGISMMLRRNGKDIARAKEEFTTKVIIAAIIFAFPTIFGLVYPVFESLGK